jgi:hypothetical protein
MQAAKGRGRKNLNLEKHQNEDKYQAARFGHVQKVRPRAAKGKSLPSTC